MSSNDQQHPYGQDPGYGHGPGPGPGSAPGHDPAYGTQQPHTGQPHAGQPYGDQSYGGQPYGADAYGAAPQTQQQGQAQAQGQSWPGGYPQEPAAPHAAPDHAVAQTWEGQTWDTQYQPVVQRPQQAAAPQQHAEPTQYLQPVQPAQQSPYPQQPQPDPQAHQAQHPQAQHQQHPQAPQAPQAQHPQPVPDAAETAYLPPVPPQGASGSYPLPPEVPVAQPVGGPATGSVTGAVTGSADVAPVPDADGYSAPTTVGNSRITDAQRARAEGRSPIIAPGIQPAGITAALGLLIALGAAIGSYALVVPLVLLQALTAAGWFRLNGMWPARQGIALAFAGGLVADVALLAAGRENGPAALLGTLGVWVLLTVVLQLRSRASADDRMQGLMATLASAALTVLAGGYLAAVPDAVVAGAVAVAAAALVRALPLPGPVSVVAALLVAAAGGAVGGALTDLGTKGALIGLVAGGCALIGLRVASYDYPSRFVHMTAGVALPLTAAAPAVYLIGRMVA
ncbi:hypothetical protein AB0467_23845 [Streptomyces sp. NPDC052095]|uniref:hypothetical protein n=1 Tax=unclassified Streptomyces TaxID=2593676 RepID=UPI003450C7C9